VKDVVKRGQDVWVKVISTSGQRLSLSMRDVDQATGQDLLPMGRHTDALNPAGPGAGGKNALTALHGLSGIKVGLSSLSQLQNLFLKRLFFFFEFLGSN
jgi:ATP-dependent RNA helicase DHX8/PRP22